MVAQPSAVFRVTPREHRTPSVPRVLASMGHSDPNCDFVSQLNIPGAIQTYAVEKTDLSIIVN
jgi:hypothetical protein